MRKILGWIGEYQTAASLVGIVTSSAAWTLFAGWLDNLSWSEKGVWFVTLLVPALAAWLLLIVIAGKISKTWGAQKKLADERARIAEYYATYGPLKGFSRTLTLRGVAQMWAASSTWHLWHPKLRLLKNDGELGLFNFTIASGEPGVGENSTVTPEDLEPFFKRHGLL